MFVSVYLPGTNISIGAFFSFGITDISGMMDIDEKIKRMKLKFRYKTRVQLDENYIKLHTLICVNFEL
jgi:hypothetical protein